MTCDRECSEISTENVLFLSVKIDLERFHILHSTETCLAVLRFEVVVVVCYVTDEVNRPTTTGCPAQICLVVNESRTVLARCLQRAQQIAVRLIAQAVTHGEILITCSYIGAGSKQTGSRCGFPSLRTTICNVKCRRHLVAVFRLEAACGETDALHHITIDDR